MVTMCYHGYHVLPWLLRTTMAWLLRTTMVTMHYHGYCALPWLPRKSFLPVAGCIGVSGIPQIFPQPIVKSPVAPSDRNLSLPPISNRPDHTLWSVITEQLLEFLTRFEYNPDGKFTDVDELQDAAGGLL